MSLGSIQQIQILHVDDDPSITELTAKFLERESDRFTVETANSADEGIDRIDDRPPDCVISDYNMPGKNGLEFLRAVRKEHPDLPFILFTGKGSEAVASDAISAGVTDYLQKQGGNEQYELLANRARNAVRARRQTERADRQEQLMRLTEFAGDTGGFELDVDSEEVLLTDGTRRLVGLSDDTQLTQEETIELYHPDDQSDVRETFQRAGETGEQRRGTWRLQTLHGDERLVDVTIVPVTEDGEVTTFQGAVHDVTDQRKRTQDLEQIETLFQHAQDSLFLIDVGEEFTVERVNPAYEMATGLSADWLEGRNAREIFGEQQGATVERRYSDCVQCREPLEYTEKLRFDGDMTEWETRIAPVVFDGSVEYIVGATRDVTARKERERELSRLQQAIDDANVPITLADPTQAGTPLVYVNNAFEEMTGYTPEEALGRNYQFLQDTGTNPEKAATLREAIDNEEQISVELRNYRKDGTEFWNRLTVTPIYDDGGDLVRYLGTQKDVTERKERERELRRERRFIEQALDTLDDLFYVLDTDGSFRRWNDRVPQVTGYTDAELTEMRAVELFPEEDRKTIADAIETAKSGETVTVEANLLTTDGDRRPYEFTGAPLDDPDGNTTGLVGVGRDLTDRRQRERRFQALVEESNDMITVVDADGVFQYQSPTVERILGYDPEETIGDVAWEYIHPDDRADMIEVLERGIADPAANPVVEYRVRHADGSWRWLEANGNNQLDNPAVEGYVINSRDITARKEREQELTQAQSLMTKIEQLADVGAWEYDADTEALVTTDGVHRILGLEPDADLTLEEAFEYFHKEDRERLIERFNECLETGRPYEIDVRLTTTDGAEEWVTARVERITDSEDAAVVRGYVQLITGRKQMERDIERERDRFTGIVETVPVGITVHDGDGSILFVNEQMESIVGRTLADLEGNPHDDSQYDLVDKHGEPLGSGETPLDQVVSQGTAVHNQVVGARRPSGERVWLSVSGAPQYNDDGEVERTVFAFEDITEQRELEVELSEILGRISDAFFALDDEYRVTHMNSRAEELLEVSEAELLGTGICDAYPKAGETDKITDVFHHAMDTQTPQDLELYYEPLGFWIDGTVYPSESGVSVYFRDATEQKQREQELQKYGTIIEALSDAVYVLDEEARFTFVNDEFVELVGYDRETILGSTPSLIKDEDAVARGEEELGRLLSSEGPASVVFEVTIHPKDGDPIVCQDHMGVLPYDGDQFNGSVGTLRNITEQKARARELETVHSQYRTLVENMPDGGVFLFNDDLEYVQAGGQELTDVGLSSEEVIGATPHDLFPEEIADGLARYYRATLDGASHAFEQKYDGEQYHIQTTPVETGDGEVAYGMAVSTNVTERIEQRQELERQKTQLEEFASIVSHDLRGPLAVAEGNLELARESCESDLLAEAAGAIERSQALIDDLLTLARQGETVAETEPVGIESVAESSWRTVGTGEATLDIDAAQVIEADRSRLQELLENLYRNAVEHGDEAVTISVGVLDDGFYVEDDGPGIPPEHREDVFEYGYSTAPDGTGFGLSIVQQVVDALGWEIRITDGSKGGARFEITGVSFTERRPRS